MSCNNCGQPTCQTPNSCYEARLDLGLNEAKTAIVGKLDGVPIIPIELGPAIKVGETSTTLKYNQEEKALEFQNERSKNDSDFGSDFVTVAQLLSGAKLTDLGSVGDLTEGGLATIILENGELQLIAPIPEPIGVGEISEGFITYVADPNSGSRYKLIKPDTGGDSDTVLIGHPNGSIEFGEPLPAPLLIPVTDLESDGVFSGTPSDLSHGDWGYQSMGISPDILNTSGSKVLVTLSFRYSMQTSGTHSGIYCKLQNGGADFVTEFVEGESDLKLESYPGGFAQFSCILEPNQKCRFEFGGWSDDDGAWDLTIGSYNENGAGVPTPKAVPPVITQRRLI